MTIIVTGGAGFIGSNFIFHMLEAYPDDRIICLDKLTYAGNLSTLKSAKAYGKSPYGVHLKAVAEGKVKY